MNKEINSIEEFIEFVSKLKDGINNVGQEKEEYEIVYRAYRSFSKIISDEKASLFSENLSEHEKAIYNEFIASNPDEFLNMTTFDKLTKMRHYEVPNRLLDVTFDPLLAVFFALGNEKHEGSKKVCIYVVKKEYVKDFDSDTVTVLSALTHLKYNDKKILKKIVNNLKKYEDVKNCRMTQDSFKDVLQNIKKVYTEIYSNFKEMQEILEEKKNRLIEKRIKTSGKITPNELFNILVSVYVHELNWQIKKEIPSWYDDVLDISTFTHCYLVKPKYNNPRIVAQSGAFFIYPFEDTDIKSSLLNFEDKKSGEKFSGYEICNLDTTYRMKKHLEILNIKETKFFNDDLKVFAEEIKEKYKKKV